MLSRLIGLFILFVLAACGGGDTPAPPVANRAPTFTSAATATIAENAVGTALTVTATDPDANPVTISISGGADAARFSITAGALAFTAAPDFERPTDANTDNVYQVQLTASDGLLSVTQLVDIMVTNVGPDAFRVRRVATGFNQPLFAAGVPGRPNIIAIVEKTGRIRLLNATTGAINATAFLDVSAQITTDSERGLLGLAFAPDYATSRTFYVNLKNLAGETEVRRYQVLAADPDRADPATANVILRYSQRFSNHNGGWIGFGPDNLLYIGTGDGGSGGDPDNNGQNPASLLGKMLRIDVRSDAFPADDLRDYAIPAGNPFAATGGAAEVWALGLRNPFRASFDPATGDLWIGDVGQGAVEEIDRVRAGQNGLHFGWSILEGTQQFKPGATTGFTPPVAQYLHGSGPLQGRSVTGGHVYRGPVESLNGRYIFGDFVVPNIWSIAVAAVSDDATIMSEAFTVRTTAFAPTAGAINNIASFGTDPANGNLFIVDFDGDIFLVEPS